MNIIKSFGCLLIALLAGFSSVASADLLFQGTRVQTTHWQNFSHAVARASSVQARSIRATAVRVNYAKQTPDNSNVIVVRRHATYWVEPVHGHGRIRITVPVEFYMSSWDVKALERELERLGIKVKPKPVPRPGPVMSG